jgi:RNA polymerase sigma factor (sigma-70 family)
MAVETERQWALTTIGSQSLACRLQDPRNEDAWRQVEDRYGPMVRLFARHMGLPSRLADEARQDAMLGLVKVVRAGKYDSSKGRLRALLFGIARHKIVDIIQRETDQQRVGLQPDRSSFFGQVPSEKTMEDEWRRQEAAAIAAQCLREARAHFSRDTYRMYVMHGVKRTPSKVVAERLGKTEAAVNMATQKVRAYLNEIHPEMQEIF